MSGKVLTIDAVGNKVERPTSFPTVAAAESASFLPGETCSILETGRNYQFDAAATAVRDGIRVLAPAGGGRLLMTAPVMTDAEAAAATRIATAAQDGLMSAAQAASVARDRGSGTTSSRNALTGLAAGQTWYNTDRDVTETYNGTVWLSPGVYQMTNRHGGRVDEGMTVILNESYSSAIKLTTDYGSYAFGVVVDGGADGAEITIAQTGVRNVAVYAWTTVTVGSWLAPTGEVDGHGHCYALYNGDFPADASIAQALVASASGANRLVKALIGISQQI
jgi:hypothetical protein